GRSCIPDRRRVRSFQRMFVPILHEFLGQLDRPNGSAEPVALHPEDLIERLVPEGGVAPGQGRKAGIVQADQRSLCVSGLLTSAPSRERSGKAAKASERTDEPPCAMGSFTGTGQIRHPPLDGLGRVVSRSVSRKPWNFSAVRRVKRDRSPDLVK